LTRGAIFNYRCPQDKWLGGKFVGISKYKVAPFVSLVQYQLFIAI